MGRRTGWGGAYRYRNGWRASLYVLGHRERHYFPTQDLALAWLKERRRYKAQVEAGGVKVGSAEDVRVRDLVPLLVRWYETRTDLTHSARTLTEYRSQLARIAARFGERRLRGLKDHDVEEWFGELRQAGRSSSHLRHLAYRLRQLCALAVREGYLATSPLAVRPPRLRIGREPRRLSEVEAGRLLEAARQDWDRRAVAVVLLALDGGLRATEIAQLRVEDVSPERIRVESRGERTDRTKSGWWREVPVRTSRLRRVLVDLAAGRPPGDRLLEVASRDGLYGLLGRAWRRAGLAGGVELHALRRAFARTEADLGTPIHHVQAMLGHRVVQTTMSYVGRPEAGHIGPRRGPNPKMRRPTN